MRALFLERNSSVSFDKRFEVVSVVSEAGTIIYEDRNEQSTVFGEPNRFRTKFTKKNRFATFLRGLLLLHHQKLKKEKIKIIPLLFSFIIKY